MTECDTLLMIGSGFPYSEFLPKEGQARGVQIDIKPDMLSLRYPMEVNLVGDSAETLRALLPLLEQKTDRRLARARSRGMSTTGGRRWKSARCSRRESGQSAARRVGAVAAPAGSAPSSPAIPAPAPTGTPATCKIRRGMMCSLSGGLASMGAAVPYAIAAKFAHPDRPGDRAGRRRRDADEQHGRADHRRQILARMGRSALDRAACSTTRTSTR